MSNHGNEARINITYFDGINGTVQPNLAKNTELSHAENVRAPIIGVLETREGQRKIGTKTDGNTFTTIANYGLATFRTEDTSQEGVFRISDTTTTTPGTQFSSVISSGTGPGFLFISVADTLYVTDPVMAGTLDLSTYVISNASGNATLYSLGTDNKWEQPSGTGGAATNILGGQFNFAQMDEGLLMVNGVDNNKLLKNTGHTVIESTDAGSLYNSPRAKFATYYKSRIYLANFIRNGVKYENTVLRSSYAMGLISLISGDHLAHVSGTDLNVTETKYLYSDGSMNSYDVYRGPLKIGSFNITAVKGTSVTITHSGTIDFNSSDEIWIAGTYEGQKQYRWVNNPTESGQSAKMYDTFKITGDGGPITIFSTIGNVMIMGNKKNMASWNDYTLENFDSGVGCVSPTGFVKHYGTLYFVGYDGIFGTTGAAPTLVSRKAERYFKGATREGLEKAAMGHKELSVFAAIGDVTLYKPDGSVEKVLNDVCVEYNTSEKNLYVHTNVPASQMQTYVDSLGMERCLISHTGSGCSIKEFLVGHNDDGAEIFTRIDTSELYFMKELENFVKPLRIITNFSRGSLIKTFISPDDQNFYELKGTNSKGISQIYIDSTEAEGTKPIECRRLRISLRGSSKQASRLQHLAVTFIPTGINISQ